jgi:hypothetical protein
MLIDSLATAVYEVFAWTLGTLVRFFFVQPQIGIVRFLLPFFKPPDKMSPAFAVADFVLLCSCERYHVFRWWSTSSKVLPYFKHKKTNCCTALVVFSVGRGTSDAFWPIDGSGCMEAPQGWTLVWCQILVYIICKILKKNMPNKKRPNCFSYYYVRVLRVDSILGTGRETHHTWAGETKHKSWQLVWMFSFNVEVGSSFVELICPRRTCFFCTKTVWQSRSWHLTHVFFLLPSNAAQHGTEKNLQPCCDVLGLLIFICPNR